MWTHMESHNNIISIKIITNQETFQTSIYSIYSAHLAWTCKKITLGVFTYDTIQSEKMGKIPFKILRLLNINCLDIYQK